MASRIGQRMQRPRTAGPRSAQAKASVPIKKLNTSGHPTPFRSHPPKKGVDLSGRGVNEQGRLVTYAAGRANVHQMAEEARQRVMTALDAGETRVVIEREFDQPEAVSAALARRLSPHFSVQTEHSTSHDGSTLTVDVAPVSERGRQRLAAGLAQRQATRDAATNEVAQGLYEVALAALRRGQTKSHVPEGNLFDSGLVLDPHAVASRISERFQHHFHVKATHQSDHEWEGSWLVELKPKTNEGLRQLNQGRRSAGSSAG